MLADNRTRFVAVRGDHAASIRELGVARRASSPAVFSAGGDGDDGVLVAGDLDTALARAHELDDEVFLIGGAAVFDEALERDLVDTMVVTHVPLSPPGDTFFAPIDSDRWTEVARESHAGTPDYEITTYERR